LNSKRCALITGGTRGIGLGIAKALAAAGLDLSLCGRRSESDVAKTIERLKANSPGDLKVVYSQCDVSVAADRQRMVDATKSQLGRLDILVNNAGIAPPNRADILEATEADFEQVLGVNLQGPYFLTQQVANWMIEQQKDVPDFHGCIVNMSSISAIMASVARGEYCISKAGISMASQLWAVRLAEFGIDVFEVRPGIIETDMTSGVKEKYDQLISEGLIPQNRWGTPDDIGRVVTALAKGDLPYSTGQVITVDGGLGLRRL